jgi:hypothetical protein
MTRTMYHHKMGLDTHIKCLGEKKMGSNYFVDMGCVTPSCFALINYLRLDTL